VSSINGVWAEPQPKSNLVHFSFKILHLVAPFWAAAVDTYAKLLVHYWPRTSYVLNWQNCIGINVRTCPLLRPRGGESQSGSGALYRTLNVYINGKMFLKCFAAPCVSPRFFLRHWLYYY